MSEFDQYSICYDMPENIDSIFMNDWMGFDQTI